jgi:hypothetical protein
MHGSKVVVWVALVALEAVRVRTCVNIRFWQCRSTQTSIFFGLEKIIEALNPPYMHVSHKSRMQCTADETYKCIASHIVQKLTFRMRQKKFAESLHVGSYLGWHTTLHWRWQGKQQLAGALVGEHLIPW